VAALAGFYKIDAGAILVAHDELDLPPGTARFKLDGDMTKAMTRLHSFNGAPQPPTESGTQE
jgi:peptidyl-tRNA hydrolase